MESLVEIKTIKLVGLSLQTKTSNDHGQSAIDCKALWELFVNNKYAERINSKTSEDIIGVYYDYEADSSKPFSYFVGCSVHDDEQIPGGCSTLVIPAGKYLKINAKGKMPDCVVNAWKKIWTMDIRRSYQIDFEVYDERSRDWNDAEVDLYLSVAEK